MPTLPVKERYRPTLGDLLAPRWRAASPLGRRVWAVLAAVVAVLIVALVLAAPRDPWLVHGSSPAFSLQYPRDMHRVSAPAGSLYRAEQRDGQGRLVQSIEVAPLHLPPFSGDVSAEFPLYSYGYLSQLPSRFPSFQLSSEGKTRVDTIPGYWLAFTTTIDGRTMLGRTVFLVPTLSGSRDGVTITMLTTPRSNVATADQVGVAGELYEPLHTFRFG
jgi:hypothetical protein